MRQQVDKREDCPRNVTLVAAESETIGLFRVSFRSKTVGMRILSFSVSRHSDQRGQFGVVYDRQKRRVLAVASEDTQIKLGGLLQDLGELSCGFLGEPVT